MLIKKLSPRIAIVVVASAAVFLLSGVAVITCLRNAVNEQARERFYYLVTALVGFGVALICYIGKHLTQTERRRSTAARHDEMTGLPNRLAFNDLLNTPTQWSRAVLLLDIKHFRHVNASMGHAVGDQIIANVAKRLSTLSCPNCILARFAGDEFAFVLSGPEAQTRADKLAYAVEGAVSKPFDINGHQIRLHSSIGYATQIDSDISGDELVRQADLAIQQAKRRLGSNPVAFSALLAETSTEALSIERSLRVALAEPGQISILYQPIVRPDGGLERAEVLARWTSPELGSVSPVRFIPVAERTGLIVELGRQLFEIICSDLEANPELKVSINVSPLQLMTPDFIPSALRNLRERDIAPGRIEVELTESLIVEDPHLAADRLEELHGAGFSTALDDFGSGYSSMGYLQQMRFRTLKIDRSFIAKARDSDDGVSVVDGMIRIAHGLQMRVVCEGIETARELHMLQKLGCDLAQGFHLDGPLPISALVERWLSRPALNP